MLLAPPRSPLFPYTTLFRSLTVSASERGLNPSCLSSTYGSRNGIMPAATTAQAEDRKSTRLNSSHITNSYAVFCLKKKKVTSPQNNTVVQRQHNITNLAQAN